MSLVIRPATPEDAELVARLIYLSMGELADYLFAEVRLSVGEILAGLFLMGDNRLSRNATDVAEWDSGSAEDAHAGYHRMVKELV